jgi:hypothetical protein
MASSLLTDEHARRTMHAESEIKLWPFFARVSNGVMLDD